VNIEFQNPTTGAAVRRASPAAQNGATTQATFLNNFQPFSIGTSGPPTSTNPFTIPDSCYTDTALTTTVSVACQQTYTQNGLNIQPSNLINEACNAINAVGQFKDVLSCVGTGVTVVSCLLSETGLGAAICAGALEDAATTAGLATECLQFIATQLTQRFLGDAAAQILDQIFVLQDPTDPANILSEGCTVLQDLFPPSPGDPGGRVYVADASANVIKVYGSQGNLITVTGTFPGLSTPDGMAYDASNQRIYVANLGNNTVTVYNLDGTLVDLGATAFSGLNDPEDIAFNPINKHFYINEPSTNQVLVFDENGVSVPLAPGAFAGLNSPFGLGWDSANGLIYVTNAGNNTMNIYDQLGNPIQTTVGAFPGLNSPDDVSWDPLTGNLYVTGVATDPLGACVINQVFVYTPDGNVVSTTGFTGLNGPDAIVSNGNAVAPLYYVTNICGGTVSVFDKNGGTVTLPTGAFTGLVQPTGVLVIP
jgi:DNA-binding beta-propeller fold protein YncE